MSQFNCSTLRSHVNFLMTSCLSKESRKKNSEDKLKEQALTQTYQIREFEKKIEDCDAKKRLFAQQKKIKDAKDAVREKFKLQKKLEKLRELHDFTTGLLEQISDTATLKETMTTLHEAQAVFKSIDAHTVYERFDKLSGQFMHTREQVMDANDLVTTRMGDIMAPMTVNEEAELNAELEELEALATSDLPTVPTQAPTTAAAQAYARAGLI